jgi:metal-sulfur cluster biosynthetic enzyme
MPTEVEICTALNEVIQPSFGISLIALNMVHAVRVSNDAVEVDLVMNCPGCPAGEVALALVHQKIESLSVNLVRLNLLPQYWTPLWE